jgi:excisionase family DNA binding protein
MDLCAAIRELAQSLPPHSLMPVPRELILECLCNDPCDEREAPALTSAEEKDLTVADLAALFNRAPSTVRAWLEAGQFEGAYRLNGRAWRVPRSAVRKFRERQQLAHPARRSLPATKAADSRGKLSDWRVVSSLLRRAAQNGRRNN